MDEHGAEDVLSAVTERALRNGLAPKGESWFAYMREAARNQASNDRRRAERAAGREVEVFALSGLDSTVDGVAARMVWLDALADLDRLPDVERRVFWMRHYDDASRAEIAAATGLTLSGVSVRLRQATKRLRRFQQDRESSHSYVLLLVLGSTSRRAPLTAPPALACVGVTVLSVFAVIALPAPRLLLGDYGHRPAHRATSNAPGAPMPVAASGPSRGIGLTPDDKVALRLAANRSVPRPDTPGGSQRPPLEVGVCAGPTCVTTDNSDFAPRGDRVTVRAVNVSATQRVTPLCWLLPDNDDVTCESGNPDDYAVPPPVQEPPPAKRKSDPSTPAPQEPSKGSR